MSHKVKPRGKRGCGYIRVSDGDKQDPQRQRTMILAWAERNGVTITKWFEDIKGRNPRDRSDKRADFQRMIAEAEEGKWDFIVVDSQDRFGTADDIELGFYLHRIRQADCELWSTDASQGRDGLLTATGAAAAFTRTAKSVVSEGELLEYGKRQVSSKREHAKKGEWQGGYVPFAFDVVCLNATTNKEVWRVVILKMVPKKDIWHRMIVYPDGRQERCDGENTFPKKQDWEKLELAPSIIAERVETAIEIFDLFASGAWSVRGLCDRLNQRHIDPVTGEGWYHTRLQPMLKNPLYYVGQTVYGKQSHGKNAWFVGGEYLIPPKKKGKATTGRKNPREDWVFPPAGTAIIKKERFDEVQARLDGKPEFKRGLRDERLWLAGLVVCDRCGQKMSGWSQSGLSYYCTSYGKYGKANSTGCRLHKVRQDVIEAHLATYLEEIEADVRLVIQSQDEPALLKKVVAERGHQTAEFWKAVQAMRDYLREAGMLDDPARCWAMLEERGWRLEEDTEEFDPYDPGHCWAVLELYQMAHDQQRGKMEAELEAAKGELRNLIVNLNRIPADQSEAVELQQELITEANRKVRELKERLVPLEDRLEAAYQSVQTLEVSITEAKAALVGDDARRKALALRKVVSEIRLEFRHYEHVCRDRRSKSKTAPRSTAEAITFVPVQGEPARHEVGPQALTVANQPGPD